MDFDKSKVYTVITADEVEIGSKGYYADCPKDLEERVNSDNKTYYDTLIGITPTSEVYRFKIGAAFSSEYALFYLVEEPEKKKLQPYRDTDEMVDHFCRHFNLIPQEHCLPRIWIKGKPEGRCKDEIVQVVGFYNNLVIVGRSNSDENELSLYELFVYFTYLDGSPCGVKEEE